MKLGLSRYDCIEIVDYMLKKMGIEVNSSRFSPWNIDEVWTAHALGYDIAPKLSITAPLSSCVSCQPNKMSWREYMVGDILVSLCLGITGFKIHSLNVVIVNPFFGAESILKAKSIEEAIVQADLWFPGDNSREVLSYIAEKEIERYKDGKTRCMA